MNGGYHQVEPLEHLIGKIESPVPQYFQLRPLQHCETGIIPVEFLNLLPLFHKPLDGQAASYSQSLGVIGQGYVAESPLSGCRCQFFQRMHAVAPLGVNVQVSTDIACRNQLGK